MKALTGFGGIEDQRTRFFLWVPVFFGAGVVCYFSIRFEPALVDVGGVALAALMALLFARALPVSIRPIVYAGIVVALGFLNATLRAHTVAGPVLGWHYYGPVEGTVVALDRSGSDKPRVTLADPVLLKVNPDRTPNLVRISLHSDSGILAPKPGTRIMVTARLSPPSGPVEPGGFDFRRLAWFRALGAVGYTRAPALLAEPADVNSFSLRLFDLRMRLSGAIRDRLADQAGAFASAIITGDRSAIDPELLADLRRSNLAHLLAISGLHMGLLTGFVFALVRYGLALFPFVALRLPTKKLAALCALGVGLGYLGISGASIATQRAFIMVSVMLLAVLLDRPAITLRAVAVAALIILLLRPETIVEPGFQMSFAATTALVSSFDYLRHVTWWTALNRGRFKILRPVIAVIASSAIAGAATAPIAAFHFNQLAKLGLLANLLSVPVMGMAVMPGAVVAAILSLVGLEGVALWVMQSGIRWILTVAHWISGIEGSVRLVPSSPEIVLALMASGMIGFALWQGWLRWIGIAVAMSGLLIWNLADRPDILITDNGRMVGVMSDAGRALSRKRGNGFAANTWLENDGDPADQLVAQSRGSFEPDNFIVTQNGASIGYFWSKDDPKGIGRDICGKVDILVAPKGDQIFAGNCEVLSASFLRQSGSLAIDMSPGGPVLTTAQQATGARLWNSKDIRAASKF